MTFYDSEGNIVYLEVSDNSEEIQLLTSQLEEIKTLNKCQADSLLELKSANQALNAQNQTLIEMNQYSGYTFVLVLAFLLYRIISGALSSMFGG